METLLWILICVVVVLTSALIYFLLYYQKEVRMLNETTIQQAKNIHDMRAERTASDMSYKSLSRLYEGLMKELNKYKKPKLQLRIDCETAIQQLEQISNFLQHFDYHLQQKEQKIVYPAPVCRNNSYDPSALEAWKISKKTLVEYVDELATQYCMDDKLKAHLYHIMDAYDCSQIWNVAKTIYNESKSGSVKALMVNIFNNTHLVYLSPGSLIDNVYGRAFDNEGEKPKDYWDPKGGVTWNPDRQNFEKKSDTETDPDKYYWWYLGPCVPAPIYRKESELGTHQRKRFDSEEECQAFIDACNTVKERPKAPPPEPKPERPVEQPRKIA